MKNYERFLKNNASTMLTVASAVGVIATTIMAVKATPKAIKILEDVEKEKGDNLTKEEILRHAGPVYIPTGLVGLSTLICIFGANVLNKRNQACLISAYSLVNNSFDKYKNKLKELYGEEAHEAISNAIIIEEANDVNVQADCLFTCCDLASYSTSDKKLFYDEYSQRYFESTMEQVISAEYHLNRNYVLRGDAALNEFYEFLGIELTDFGNEVGWSCSDGVYWIDFNHREIKLDDGRECYVISMAFSPETDFWNV